MSPANRTRQRNSVLVLALLTALAAIVFALSRRSAPSAIPSSVTNVATPRITYAMPITIAAIPAYVASEKGFWHDEGLEVERKMFSAGRLALDALISNSAEVMSVSETPLVHAILKGNEVSFVAAVTEHQETKFIGRLDRGIKNPATLKGKRIATLPGTNSDYFMYELFRVNGLSAGDVKVSNLPPPDMVTALVSGAIDGYFAWEPHISYAQKKLAGKAIVIPAGDLYHGRHCVAMNRKYVREHPDVVEKLLRGFLRAEEYVREKPAESKRIVAKVTGLDSGTVDNLWVEYLVKVQLDRGLVAILEKESKWALSIDPGAKGTIQDVISAIDVKALNSIRPDRVEIVNP